MIYVIKENGYGYRERIVGAVSDEKTAKRYCRDMRTGRELFYEAVELDAVTMDEISAEKIYVVERRVPWKANKDVPVTEMYKELMNIDPVALVEVDHFMTVTYASLRTLRLESDLDGTVLSFWCYAKSAPAALGIMERSLKDFDPSVLEWGVYHPLKGDNKELKRRIDQFKKKKKCMLKDYNNKEVLAEMKRQINAAAKISDREARITFVLVHMISEHHELAESAGKPEGEGNLFNFTSWCLSRFTDELEAPSTEDFKNPIELFKKEHDVTLLDLVRFRTPAKNAVEKGLDESFEWPDNVPYEEWEEDMLQTAYATLFGLYFFNTPAKDLMRWLGKDEPKNYRFVNAMNRHETALNVTEERTRLREADGPLPWKKKPKRMYVNDEEMAQGKEHVNQLQQGFRKLVDMLASGDVLRFCQEKEDTAFGIFMTGTFAMMMPGKNINRKGMVSSRDNAKLVYQAAKKSLMGDKLSKQIVTAADDKAAAEVFYWGLIYGEQGVADGSMPTGMADMDIRRKPKPKLKN